MSTPELQRSNTMKENPLSASGFRLEQILPSDVKRTTAPSA